MVRGERNRGTDLGRQNRRLLPRRHHLETRSTRHDGCPINDVGVAVLEPAVRHRHECLELNLTVRGRLAQRIERRSQAGTGRTREDTNAHLHPFHSDRLAVRIRIKTTINTRRNNLESALHACSKTASLVSMPHRLDRKRIEAKTKFATSCVDMSRRQRRFGEKR